MTDIVNSSILCSPNNHDDHVLQIANENSVKNSSCFIHGMSSIDINQFIKSNVECESSEFLDHIPPIYHSDETTFTCLQRDQSYHSDNHEKSTNIRLYVSGLITKIVLDDFPITGQYTLSINGTNQCTAKLMTDENNFLKPTFDLCDLKSVRSKTMRRAINQNVRPCLVEKCYDMSNVDALIINVSSDTEIKHHHKIIVSEYKRDYFPETFSKDSFSKDSVSESDPVGTQLVKRTYDIYPYDTHTLPFNHPVYALNIMSYNNKRIRYLIVIDGASYGEFTTDNHQYIRLSDNGKIFQGSQNHRMGPEQQKSLNLSRVGCIQLIVLDNQDRTASFSVDALTFVSYYKKDIVRIYSH
jgi:hypothetical protein